MTASLDDQIAEVRRELALRKNAYPRWVKNGTLKQADADRQIARMQAVHDTLVAVQGERQAQVPMPPEDRRDG